MTAQTPYFINVTKARTSIIGGAYSSILPSAQLLKIMMQSDYQEQMV